MAAVGGFVGQQYAEEFWRRYRADRTLAAHPATARAGQPGTRRLPVILPAYTDAPLAMRYGSCTSGRCGAGERSRRWLNRLMRKLDKDAS
jgi:hypothetical protein